MAETLALNGIRRVKQLCFLDSTDLNNLFGPGEFEGGNALG